MPALELLNLHKVVYGSARRHIADRRVKRLPFRGGPFLPSHYRQDIAVYRQEMANFECGSVCICKGNFGVHVQRVRRILVMFYGAGQKENRRGRAVTTVDDYISLLCQLLRFAYRSKFISDKPFEFIPKLQKERKKPDPLQREEYSAMILSLCGQDRNLWQFAINAGPRHGELAALAWEDIDLDAGKVHIRRNLTHQGDFVPPKTRAGDRVITLLAPALEALRAQYELTGHLGEVDIVCNGREYGSREKQSLRFVFRPGLKQSRPGPFFSCQSIADRWDVSVEKAGIRRRTPYQTRHTYACWALAAGANPSFIASQLGHEDVQMVYRVYGAWIKEFDGEQVELLNSRLNIAPIMPPRLKAVG